jgi:serine/threonine-protein kinase NIM1
VDIWALGILLYFLVTGTMPFKAGTVASLKHAILEGMFITPSHVSKNCVELITNLLKRKPNSRYTMKQIASCSWLEGCDWEGEDKGYKSYPR